MLSNAPANVTLMVTDMSESIRFYTETLGLDLTVRHGDHWAEVAASGVTIGLHPGLAPEARATDPAMSIGFVVDDFDDALAGLEELGIRSDVTRTERACSAYFADPDGHSLYIHWRAS